MAKGQKDWKYVVTMRDADPADDGAANLNMTLTGPYEDSDAADEFVEDFMAMVPANATAVVVNLDDPDAVLAALKVEAKAARKAAKKAKKQAEAEAAAQAAKDAKKAKKEAKKAAKAGTDTATEADASEAVAPSTEGAAVTPDAANANGQPAPEVDEAEQQRRREISEAASKQPWAGTLADRKDEWIETWAREMTKNEVIGPLNLSVQQRRVIAALKWSREVARSNAHLNAAIPPAPIVGIDANGRIVVQGFDAATTTPKTWAVFKNGNPTDVKEPVQRLKAKVSEAV